MSRISSKSIISSWLRTYRNIKSRSSRMQVPTLTEFILVWLTSKTDSFFSLEVIAGEMEHFIQLRNMMSVKMSGLMHRVITMQDTIIQAAFYKDSCISSVATLAMIMKHSRSKELMLKLLSMDNYASGKLSTLSKAN